MAKIADRYTQSRPSYNNHHFYYGPDTFSFEPFHKYCELTFHASVDFCYLLITFASSLDPDQVRQNIGLNLDPNHSTF